MKTQTLMALLALAAAQGTARAAQDGNGETGATPLPRQRMGVVVATGGGLMRSLPRETRDLAGNAGCWEVRTIFGTRRLLGAELAYTGSARHLGGARTPPSTLVGHGAEALLRLSTPGARAGALYLQPFSFMGLAWTRYRQTGAAGDAQHVLTVPVGLGLAFGQNGVHLDLRLGYHPILAGDPFGAVGDGEAPLQSWSLGALVGLAL